MHGVSSLNFKLGLYKIISPERDFKRLYNMVTIYINLTLLAILPK